MNRAHRRLSLLSIFLLGGCSLDSPPPGKSASRSLDSAAVDARGLGPRDPDAGADLARPTADAVLPAQNLPSMRPPKTLGEQEGAPAWAEQDPADGMTHEIFERAPPVEATVLNGARLVCRAWDQTAPNLLLPKSAIPIVAQVATAPPLFHQGPLDRSGQWFIVPVAALRTGDRLAVSRSSRESFRPAEPQDAIVYAGRFPLRFVADQLEVECRALTREHIERMLPSQLAALDAAIGAVRLTVAPKRDHLGRDDSRLPVAQRRLYSAAALAGWSDARIQKRSALVAALLARWESNASAAVQKLAATLPRPGAELQVKGVGRLHALPLRCVPADLSSDAVKLDYHRMLAAGCFIEITITPERLMATESLLCTAGERSLCLGRLRVVLANGTTTRPRLYQVRDEGAPFRPSDSSTKKDLTAGHTYVLLFDPDARVSADPSPLHPALLQGSWGSLALP